MARALRLLYPGAFYHVTCRGNAQQKIFLDDQDRHTFLTRLTESLRSYQVLLHTYVLMLNHFHLVVETPSANLSEFMRHLNVTYTGYFNRRHSRVGHLYQGRFKSILVEADSYLVQLSRYVHLNPVRIERLRQRPVPQQLNHLRRYAWSSLPGYLDSSMRVDFTQYASVLEEFGGDDTKGRRAYGKFIEEGVTNGVSSPWDRLKGQVVLGRESFVKQATKQLWSKAATMREQPAARALSRLWEIDELLKVLAPVLERSVRQLCTRGGGLERAMVMECLHRHTSASQAEIGRRVGGVDYSWVSQMRKELRHTLKQNDAVRMRFQQLEDALDTHE